MVWSQCGSFLYFFLYSDTLSIQLIRSIKLSKHNWKEYSEHKLAVMPPLVSEHILSRVAPRFTVNPLIVPVMALDAGGEEVQLRFPADHRVAALRGRTMVRYHADYDILAEGEQYPGQDETRIIINAVFSKAASGPMLKREAYELQSKTWAGFVLDDMSVDVRQTAREMPEYDNIVHPRDVESGHARVHRPTCRSRG